MLKNGFISAVVALCVVCFGGVPGTANSADAWSVLELQAIESLWLGSLGPPKPSLSNRAHDHPSAARLGHLLFFDAELSADGSISCASCHKPEAAFADTRARSLGLGETERNSPSLLGSGYNAWFYWDGRRDSLWAQALVPLEASNEMGITRTDVVRYVGSRPAYRELYEDAFGAFPTLPPSVVHAGPFGTQAQREAWAAMSNSARAVINRVFANVGKAIAAYERKLVPLSSRFDVFAERLLSGTLSDDKSPLSAEERLGLKLFIDDERTRCLQCHNGPLFSNYDFHNVGTGWSTTGVSDDGRVRGIEIALSDPFNCEGVYSDAYKCDEIRFLGRSHAQEKMLRAFKVPTLRNLPLTGPYMHDGRFQDIEQVLQHYKTPGGADGAHELVPIELDDRETAALAAFLRSLSQIETVELPFLAAPATTR